MVPAVSCTDDATKTIREVLEALLVQSGTGDGTRGDTEEIQALVDATRGYDGYNWGYDPWHYTAPEGSYSTDPEGLARILELPRDGAGARPRSSLRVGDGRGLQPHQRRRAERQVGARQDRPRLLPPPERADGKRREPDLLREHRHRAFNMMEKLMIDSVVTWARSTRWTAFRFDLMGHHMKRNMVRLRDRLKEINDKIYIYGEGWNYGEVVGGTRENRLNLAVDVDLVVVAHRHRYHVRLLMSHEVEAETRDLAAWPR